MLRNDNDATKENFEMQELASKTGIDVETYKTVEVFEMRWKQCNSKYNQLHLLVAASIIATYRSCLFRYNFTFLLPVHWSIKVD